MLPIIRCARCGEALAPAWACQGMLCSVCEEAQEQASTETAAVPTITIPVAEYEELKRQAFAVEELRYLASAVGQFDPTEYEEFTWDLFETVSAKLRAAIKEQEG